MKRWFIMWTLGALLLSVSPLSALAEDVTGTEDPSVQTGTDGSADVTDDAAEVTNDAAEVTNDAVVVVEAASDVTAEIVVSTEVAQALEVVVEETVTQEGVAEVGGEGGENTIVVETVKDSFLPQDIVETWKNLVGSVDYKDQSMVSVQWGYFPVEGEELPDLDHTTWDPTITFSTDTGMGVLARPHKLIRFEENQDSLVEDSVTTTSASFISEIWNHNDGVLFKVKTNVENVDPVITFSTAYSSDVVAVSYSQLAETGMVEFAYGDYKVVVRLWSSAEWLKDQASHLSQVSNSGGSNSGGSNRLTTRPTDIEEGAWYVQEGYLDFAINAGYFKGYQDGNGNFTGEVGPGNSLTRFEALAVLYRFASDVGVVTCDAENTAGPDWMGNHWAGGYVTCVGQEGITLTLLTDVIGTDSSNGDKAASRMEVMVAAVELLGLEYDASADTEFADNTEIPTEFQGMIEQMVQLGIIGGYSDGHVRPNRFVNRVEMMKIITLLNELLAA